MSKVSKSTAVVVPSTAEDRKITAPAKADPDAQPLMAKQLKEMVPLRALRGRPKSGNAKQLVSVRYSPEVLNYFCRRLTCQQGPHGGPKHRDFASTSGPVDG